MSSVQGVSDTDAQAISAGSSRCGGTAALLYSFRVTELLTLSLRERPATLRRKLIWAACIRDPILLVITQSSWP